MNKQKTFCSVTGPVNVNWNKSVWVWQTELWPCSGPGPCCVLPCRVCDVDSASAPQLDWTSGPRMLMRELPRFVSAAFSGATWLNWTEERQPTKPLEAAFITPSSKFSIPVEKTSTDDPSTPGPAQETRTNMESEKQNLNEDLLMSLPSVRDRIRMSSASDDSGYFLWTSWSIWWSGEKSKKTINPRQPQYFMDWCLYFLQMLWKPSLTAVSCWSGSELNKTFFYRVLTQVEHLIQWWAQKNCRMFCLPTLGGTRVDWFWYRSSCLVLQAIMMVSVNVKMHLINCS